MTDKQLEFLKSLKKGDRITLDYGHSKYVKKILENNIVEETLTIRICGSTEAFYYTGYNFTNSRLAPLRILGFTFGTGRAKRH